MEKQGASQSHDSFSATQYDLQRRIANSLLIIIACTALGGVLYFVPHVDEAFALSLLMAVLCVTAGLIVNVRKSLYVSISVLFVGVGYLFSFVTGSLVAPLYGLLAGVFVASFHTLAHIWRDFWPGVSRAGEGGNERPKPPMVEILTPPTQDIDVRKDRALEYIFGYTGKKTPSGKMDSFKYRMTRDNLETLGLLSQLEWSGWVRELQAAKVIEVVNKQVTKPLVPTYSAAKQAYEEWVDGFVFEADSDNPRKLTRKGV